MVTKTPGRRATGLLAVGLALLFGSAAARAQDGLVTLPDAAVDTGTTTADGGVALPDGPGSDAPVLSCGEIVGKPCTATGGECGAQGSCLITTAQDQGVCTCACTPDDPATPPINEDSCPDPSQHICGQLRLASGGAQNVCLQRCQPQLGANDCTAPLACAPRSAAASGKVDQAVCLSYGCTADTDCPVTTGPSCVTTQPSPCGAGEQCLPLSSGTTAGICVTAGKCDTVSGLCGKHATNAPGAKVGDPCQADLDCGEYMACERENDPQKTLGLKDHGAPCSGDGECCGRCDQLTKSCLGSCTVHARNGYCIVAGCAVATPSAFSEFACPTGSNCTRLFFGGICLKSCTLGDASSCRGQSGDKLGDYECRAWNNLVISTVQIADGPVCEFGDVLTCDIFGNSGLTCASVGDQSNATNMSCRLPDGTQLGSPLDPAGFCLDDTSSGPAAPPTPDGGPIGDASSPTGDGSVAPPTDSGGIGPSPDAGILPLDEDSGVTAVDDSGASRTADAGTGGGGGGGGGGSDGGCRLSPEADGSHALPMLLALLALLSLSRRRED